MGLFLPYRINSRCLLIAVSWLLLISCNMRNILNQPQIPGNPIDPTNSEYVPPRVDVFLPMVHDTLDTSYARIEWKGVGADSLDYQYSFHLDDRPWSEWLNQESMEYDYLEEGPHSFEIKSKYTLSGAEQETPYTLPFVVDDIQGPGIMVTPRYQTLSAGNETEIKVWAEEVSSVMGAEISLSYNPGQLEILSIEPASFFKGSDGQIIFFSEKDNVNGTANIVVVTAAGTQPMVSGSGPIAGINFRALSNSIAKIRINSSSRYMNVNDESLPIIDIGNGFIEID